MYYTDAEVTASGLDETTLRLYKFNSSSATWFETASSGVDITGNFVFGNVTSFSSFGLFGTVVAASTTATTTTTAASTSNSGGCSPQWDCSGWGTCSVGGIQTRSCSRVGTCSLGNTPSEER